MTGAGWGEQFFILIITNEQASHGLCFEVLPFAKDLLTFLLGRELILQP